MLFSDAIELLEGFDSHLQSCQLCVILCSALCICFLVLDKYETNMLQRKPLDLESRPSFIVPLRQRTAPQGYECCMSCAVKGDPAPRVLWYRNNVCLNTNPDYHITNVCGVCSLLILRVRPKDHGEYKVVVESKLGTAESSMVLGVRGIAVAGWDKKWFLFFLKRTDTSFFLLSFYRMKNRWNCFTTTQDVNL